MALLPLTFFFFFASTLAIPIVSEPHSFPAFDVGIIQENLQKEEEKCPYTVIITTSCLSPDRTRDHVSLAFGDNDGNQVHAPRLDDGEAFDKCSSNTFQIKGQCLNQVHDAYVYRTGSDGWVPETVEIFAEDEKAVKFDFDKTTNVPENTWYGGNKNTRAQLPPYFPPETPPSFPPVTPSPPPLYPPETPEFPPPPPPSRPSAASGLRADGHVVLGVLVGVVAMAVV